MTLRLVRSESCCSFLLLSRPPAFLKSRSKESTPPFRESLANRESRIANRESRIAPSVPKRARVMKLSWIRGVHGGDRLCKCYASGKRLFDLLVCYVPRVAYANTPPYANRSRRGLDACSQSRVSSQARRRIHASFSLSQLSIALQLSTRVIDLPAHAPSRERAISLLLSCLEKARPSARSRGYSRFTCSLFSRKREPEIDLEIAPDASTIGLRSATLSATRSDCSRIAYDP